MAPIESSKPVKLIIQATIAVIVITMAVNAITAAGFTDGSATVNATTGVDTTIDSSITNVPSSVTVRATTENALAFDGNHSVNSSVPGNLTNGSWTVCSTVELASDANQNATYDVIAYDNESVLLQYDAGEWSIYYDNGTHDGRATVDAPDPSGGLVPVCGRYNTTENELYVIRDGVFSSPAELTTATTSRNVSWQWEGRQDEARFFGGAVSNTTLAEYASDPVRPQPTEPRLARFMFDEGSGDTTTVYFAAAQVNVAGVTWTNGVTNPRKWLGLASAIEEGDDYVLVSDPFGIRIVNGGYLEGAPVEHVSWSDESIVSTIVGIVPVLLGLLVVVALSNEIRRML